MTVNKRKKVNKYRGHTTHGGGHRKKRRGAGSRGGRGNAGTGKRAGHKKAGISRKLGAHGFTSKRVTRGKAINAGHFTAEKVEKLVSSGKIVREGDHYLVDLKKMGYGKLLSTGNTKLKLKITVPSCSQKAEEKIKAAGGEVVSSENVKKSEENVEEQRSEASNTSEAELPAE